MLAIFMKKSIFCQMIKISKTNVFVNKINILRALLFLQLLKLKKLKCAQNLTFPYQTIIFCNFKYLFEKISIPKRNVRRRHILHCKINIFVFSSSIYIYTTTIKT